MLYAMARFSCCGGSGSPRQVGMGLSSFHYAVLARGEKRLHKFPVAIGQRPVSFAMGWSLRAKEMNFARGRTGQDRSFSSIAFRGARHASSRDATSYLV
jgi:hypothetical protein